ncbi:MAG: hypothetical protein KME54_16560 [Tolypothrix brevis GSE-NOS-MK-07-07A]|nr:hypothetical protein [Tolypothrix brevis GSE-NOS-MK-07-07A]
MSQYGSVKARDAINRRLYNKKSFVETAIYRVFVIYNFHQKILSAPYWEMSNVKTFRRNVSTTVAVFLLLFVPIDLEMSNEPIPLF